MEKVRFGAHIAAWHIGLQLNDVAVALPRHSNGRFTRTTGSWSSHLNILPLRGRPSNLALKHLCALETSKPESGNIMTDRHPKRPRDPNQLAKSIIDIATGQKPDRDPTPEEQGKDPAAVALGKKGGKAAIGAGEIFSRPYAAGHPASMPRPSPIFHPETLPQSN
jgi:hypothetical protein